mgnify:CR=1 FL=1
MNAPVAQANYLAPGIKSQMDSVAEEELML